MFVPLRGRGKEGAEKLEMIWQLRVSFIVHIMVSICVCAS
jgi:hypothetical protein